MILLLTTCAWPGCSAVFGDLRDNLRQGRCGGACRFHVSVLAKPASISGISVCGFAFCIVTALSCGRISYLENVESVHPLCLTFMLAVVRLVSHMFGSRLLLRHPFLLRMVVVSICFSDLGWVSSLASISTGILSEGNAWHAYTLE